MITRRSASQLLSFVSIVLSAAALTLVASDRALAIAYTWSGTNTINVAGNWSPTGGPPTTVDSGAINVGQANATVSLVGTPTLTVGGTGVLNISSLATPVTGGTMTINSGGRVEFTGTNGGTNTISFDNGSRISRNQLLNTPAVSNNAISINAGATVTASHMLATGWFTSAALSLQGALTGDGTTTLVVNPTIGGNSHGALRINRATANTGFTGTVNLTSTVANTYGSLILSGTGALSNVAAVNINNLGMLRLSGATNPLPAGFNINVNSGGRLEWEGTQTYSVTPPTVTLQNGATFGKDSTSPTTSTEVITIASGATVTASRIAGFTPSTGGHALTLQGALIGDGTTTLAVNPVAGGNTFGPLRIARTSANTGFTGTVNLSSSIANNFGALVLSGTGALSNVSALNVNSGGMLRLENATDPLPSAFAINIGNGGRMEWEGTQTYTVTPPTITFSGNSQLGRDALNVPNVANEAIAFASGATVTASKIAATDSQTALGLTLQGSITGDGTTKLVVNPSAGGNTHGALRLNPSVANSGFTGLVEVSSSTPGVRGTLVLAGNGALSAITGISILNGGQLRLSTATDPLPSGYGIDVNTGGRIEWDGVQTYTGAAPTVLLRTGSQLGRNLTNSPNTVNEAISLDTGATATATGIAATSVSTTTAMTLAGPLNGDPTSKLIVAGSVVNQYGALQISPTLANAFSGTVEVNGTATGTHGILMLAGTGPLQNAALLNVKQFGTVLVQAPGALNNMNEVLVENGGFLRFRNAGSTLTGTTLTGTGIVRSEIASTAPTTNQTVQSLTLLNSTLSPGLSPGVLTVEASTLAFGSGSVLEVEVGALQDKIHVVGNLSLGSGSTLDLSAQPGLTEGDYVVATYTGLLTGEFSMITANLGPKLLVGPIDYGIITPGAITVTIAGIPEPSMLVLFGFGALGLVYRVRRRR